MTPDDVDINPNFEKNTPFRVPSGYFDQLADSITMRCTEMPTVMKQPSWRTALRGQLGLAAGFAVLALLASMAYFYMQQNDVVYVEPNQIRIDNSKYNQNNAYKLTVISTIVSAASVIASLVIALALK